MRQGLVHFAAVLLAAAILAPSAEAQFAVTGELLREHDALPGATATGVIDVRNLSSRTAQVRIYQSDYVFAADGHSTYGDPGTEPRSNASWIQFSPAFLDLPPGVSMPVTYSITVPADEQGREGTYWSVLMIEEVPFEDLNPLREQAGVHQLQLRQRMRFAVQLSSQFVGTGQFDVAFPAVDMAEDENGRVLLNVDVENTGSLMKRPNMWVELFDASGRSWGRRPCDHRFIIYPGTSVRQTVDLSDLPAGSYDALFVVDAGQDELFGTQYRLNLAQGAVRPANR